MTHDELVQEAKDAIDAVFSDGSVCRSKTIESLEDIASHLELSIEPLKAEEERGDDEGL